MWTFSGGTSGRQRHFPNMDGATVELELEYAGQQLLSSMPMISERVETAAYSLHVGIEANQAARLSHPICELDCFPQFSF